MLNLVKEADGRFVMMGRLDRSFWASFWTANEPNASTSHYGSRYSDGLLYALPQHAAFGRRVIVCQMVPN